MKIKITFFDLETTSENPNTTEILTGFFRTYLIDFDKGSYEFVDEISVECKPQQYLFDSFKIHGISRDRADSFPSKEMGLRKICKYIEKHFDGMFCCHANATIFGHYGHFDWAVIHTNLLYISNEAYFWFQKKTLSAKVISTHTIARKLYGKSIGLKLKELVQYFDLGTYKEHNEKDDTLMTVEVFKKLTDGQKFHTADDLYDLGHFTGIRKWSVNPTLI